MTVKEFQEQIKAGIPDVLPAPKPYDPTINHAPKRKEILTEEERVLAIRNALRYFPAKHHEVLAREFAEELHKYGRIYMYRFRPDYEMYARPIEEYPHKSRQAAAIMVMIQNNLDKAVAQHPHELITYGGNGAVFQNWAQYRLAMQYLSEMTENQTLVMYSGHPLRGKNIEYGPHFPDMSEAYSKELIAKALEIAQEKGIKVQQGVYLGTQGPTFETPSEYKMFHILGADAVGMSTVPEVIVANHCGIKVFGESVITDLGVEGKIVEVSHEEVQKAADEAQPRMTTIMRELINRA
jgi:hypothetical protein